MSSICASFDRGKGLHCPNRKYSWINVRCLPISGFGCPVLAIETNIVCLTYSPYVFGSVYNASKAALHHYSSTLRVELAPFGVRVVTIITGGVKSNIARVDRTLNPNSIYMPIEEEYIRRVKHSQEVGMDTKKYAASVVQQVTRPGILARLFRNRNWVWEGAKSWLVWFGLTFMPKNFFVSASAVYLICSSDHSH